MGASEDDVGGEFGVRGELAGLMHRLRPSCRRRPPRRLHHDTCIVEQYVVE